MEDLPPLVYHLSKATIKSRSCFEFQKPQWQLLRMLASIAVPPERPANTCSGRDSRGFYHSHKSCLRTKKWRILNMFLPFRSRSILGALPPQQGGPPLVGYWVWRIIIQKFHACGQHDSHRFVITKPIYQSQGSIPAILSQQIKHV